MGFLLGHGFHTIDDVLTQPSRLDPDRMLSDTVDVGVDGILRALGRKKGRFGGAVKLKPSRKAAMRGALALYGSGNTAAARELIALLNSSEVFEKALAEVVNEHFGIRSWTIPA